MNSPMALFEPRRVWAMQPDRLASFYREAERCAARHDAAQTKPQRKPASYTREGDTAHIAIEGVLLRAVPDWMAWHGIAATSYADIAAMTASAAADTHVERVVLDIASPGGTVDGVTEAAAAIAALTRAKPTVARIQDLGASAAYWLASQAGNIEATETAEVGSIGVYTVLYDYAKALTAEGIETHLIRSGPFKGTGVVGHAIADDELGPVQQIVDQLAGQFIAAVASGRNVPAAKAAKWATGRLWLAPEAEALGLIDHVDIAGHAGAPQTKGLAMTVNESIDAAVAKALATEREEANARHESALAGAIAEAAETARAAAESDERQRAALLSEAFPDDPAFALAAYARGDDVTHAKAAYADVLRAKLAESHKSAGCAGGAPPIPTEGEGNDGGDFIAIARERAKAENTSVTEAMLALARERPQLHQTWLARTNGR